MKVTILGCGGSGGVPLVGGSDGTGHWGRCDPANPKNRRRRVSILARETVHDATGAETEVEILVDTSPDLREQMLAAGITRLDAVLFSHAHADHLHGIDDLRPLYYATRERIPVYASPEAMQFIKTRFAYLFREKSAGDDALYPAVLTAHEVAGPFDVAGVPIVSFEQIHGRRERTLGFRIADMAYSTDVVDLDEAAFDALAGVDVWIVDCLRFEPHPTHAHFDRTMSWIDRVKPRRAILTHMNHTVDYDEIAARCPPGVEPAFDGMEIEVTAERIRSMKESA